MKTEWIDVIRTALFCMTSWCEAHPDEVTADDEFVIEQFADMLEVLNHARQH